MEHKRTHLGDKQISAKNILVSFIIRILTCEKWFPCDQCPKSFSVSNDLNKHRIINTGEKQNSANIIIVSFIRRILTGEKYFHFDQCPK